MDCWLVSEQAGCLAGRHEGALPGAGGDPPPRAGEESRFYRKEFPPARGLWVTAEAPAPSDDHRASGLLMGASGPPLEKSARLFAAGPVVPSLPAPPKSPLARILYDLTTQLTDFELTTTIRIPVEGLNKGGPVETVTKAVLEDQGALVVLGVEFHPPWGPMPLVRPLDQVPIIGPFFKFRVLKLEMDPDSRRLRARVCYLFIPFKKEVHDLFLEKAKLSPKTMTGEGYDLRVGLPLYSWQTVDLFLKALEEKGAEGLKKIGKEFGMGDVRPLLDQGEILVEGNFSNRSVSLAGFRVNFAPLNPGNPGERHRIRVSGRLLEPVITIWGLKSGEFDHPKAQLRLVNAGPSLTPLEIHAKIDPTGKETPIFEIPHYQSDRVLLEAIPREESELKVRLEMEEGIEVHGMTFRIDPENPQIRIQRMKAKRIAFDGFGTRLRTSPGDAAVFEDVRIELIGGKPQFRGKIRGKATGEVNYFMKEEELGYMKFEHLAGVGDVVVGLDEEGRARVSITGAISTEMPELRLLVQSERMQGFVRTVIKEATVAGTGRLTIWPDSHQALVESTGETDTMVVRGKGGGVAIRHDPSEVAEWPELKRELGLAAADVKTDLHLRLSAIEFAVQRMNLKSHLMRSGRPAMEVLDAATGPVSITGDLWGRMFVRIPGGFYLPVVIPKEAMMKGATVQVGRITDRLSETGRREVDFSQILISGVESQPTFSPKDRKRCGIDRQHIHAVLGFFQFSPDDRALKIGEVDPHFHVFLKDLINGGCVKVE